MVRRLGVSEPMARTMKMAIPSRVNIVKRYADDDLPVFYNSVE